MKIFVSQTALSIALISIGLGGCASTKDEQAFGKAVADASTSLTSGVTLAEKIQFEDQLTEASKAFLLDRPRTIRITRSCDTDADREVALAKKRLVMFGVIKTYFESIDAMLKNQIDFTKYAAEIQSASSLVSSLGLPVSAEMGAINTIIGALAKAANVVEQNMVLAEISRTAQAVQKNLTAVVGDISAGLVSSEENLNADVKLWEQCEYERLRLIFVDSPTTKAEMSGMFETFRAKLASLKAQSGVVIGTRGKLEAVVRANEALGTFKLDYQTAKSIVSDASSVISNFQAAIDAAGKIKI